MQNILLTCTLLCNIYKIFLLFSSSTRLLLWFIVLSTILFHIMLRCSQSGKTSKPSVVADSYNSRTEIYFKCLATDVCLDGILYYDFGMIFLNRNKSKSLLSTRWKVHNNKNNGKLQVMKKMKRSRVKASEKPKSQCGRLCMMASFQSNTTVVSFFPALNRFPLTKACMVEKGV